MTRYSYQQHSSGCISTAQISTSSTAKIAAAQFRCKQLGPGNSNTAYIDASNTAQIHNSDTSRNAQIPAAQLRMYQQRSSIFIYILTADILHV